jgi:hypothetical protein
MASHPEEELAEALFAELRRIEEGISLVRYRLRDRERAPGPDSQQREGR